MMIAIIIQTITPPIVEPIIKGKFYDLEGYIEGLTTVWGVYYLHSFSIGEKVKLFEHIEQLSIDEQERQWLLHR